MTFDKKLRALRLMNNMTQDYVANRINVARSTIAGYETKGRQPSHEKLAALANIYHVSIDYLLDDETITVTPSQISTALPAEQFLLEKFKVLSPDSQKDLLQYLHLLELRENEQNT